MRNPRFFQQCRNLSRLAALSFALTFSSAQAQQPQRPPVKVTDGRLTDSNAMSLYIYDDDAKGTRSSLCKGPCTTIWPPLTATAGAQDTGDFSVIERDDGSLQWAYKGKPLYFYARDPQAGVRTGEDANRKWHSVKP